MQCVMASVDRDWTLCCALVKSKEIDPRQHQQQELQDTKVHMEMQ